MAGSHIAIPTILKIGSGTLGNVGKYLQSSGFKKAVVFFGNGLVEMFGKTVMDSLSEADIEVLSYCELDTTDIKDIIDLAFTIDSKTQVILGIGGGKVIDAGKYAAYIPMAALAAVLINVAWNMAGFPAIRSLLKGQKSDIAVFAVTFLITVFIDLTVAIEVGLGFAAFFFIKKMIDLSEVQNEREILTGGIKKDQPSENLDIPANTFVYEIEGPLFFGTVRKFELATERARTNCKYLVLRMRNTIYLDAGGIKALEQCKAACDRKGITIVISGIHTQPYLLLEKTGMADKLGRENIFDNINDALERCKRS